MTPALLALGAHNEQRDAAHQHRRHSQQQPNTPGIALRGGQPLRELSRLEQRFFAPWTT